MLRSVRARVHTNQRVGCPPEAAETALQSIAHIVSIAKKIMTTTWDQPPMDNTATKALEVAEIARNLAESARAIAQQVRK